MQDSRGLEAKLAALLNAEVEPDIEQSQDALLQERRSSGSAGKPPKPPLIGGEGSGNSGGMEARLAKLEAHMEHVLADVSKLSAIPAEIATLTERVSHLPTKDELGTKLRNYLVVAGIIFTIIGTLIGLAFKFMGK